MTDHIDQEDPLGILTGKKNNQQKDPLGILKKKEISGGGSKDGGQDGTSEAPLGLGSSLGKAAKTPFNNDVTWGNIAEQNKKFEDITGHKEFTLGSNLPQIAKAREEKKFQKYRKIEDEQINPVLEKVQQGSVKPQELAQLYYSPWGKKIVPNIINNQGTSATIDDNWEDIAFQINAKNRPKAVEAQDRKIQQLDNDILNGMSGLSASKTTVSAASSGYASANTALTKLPQIDVNDPKQIGQAISILENSDLVQDDKGNLVKGQKEALLKQLNTKLFFLNVNKPIDQEISSVSPQIKQAVTRFNIDRERGEKGVFGKDDEANFQHFITGLNYIKDARPNTYQNIMRGIAQRGEIADLDMEQVAGVGQDLYNEKLFRLGAKDPNYINKESNLDYESYQTKKANYSLALSEHPLIKAIAKDNLGKVPQKAIDAAAKDLGLTNAKVVEDIKLDEANHGTGVVRSGKVYSFFRGLALPFKGVQSTANAVLNSPVDEYLNSRRLDLGDQQVADGQGNYRDVLPSERENTFNIIMEGGGQFVAQLLQAKGMGKLIEFPYAQAAKSVPRAALTGSQKLNIAAYPGTVASIVMQSYGDSYKYFLDKTGDPSTARLAGAADAAATAAFELILPDVKIADSAAKMLANSRKKLAQEIVDVVKNGAGKSGVGNAVKNFTAETISVLGKEIAEEDLTNIENYITQAIVSPKTVGDRDLAKELWDTTKTTALQMVIPAFLGAAGNTPSIKKFSKDGLHTAAINFDEYKQALDKSLADNSISEQEYNTAINVLQNHKNSIDNAPKRDINGDNISSEKQLEYAYQNTVSKVNKALAEAQADDVLREPIAKKVQEAEDIKRKIFNGEKVDDVIEVPEEQNQKTEKIIELNEVADQALNRVKTEGITDEMSFSAARRMYGDEKVTEAIEFAREQELEEIRSELAKLQDPTEEDKQFYKENEDEINDRYDSYLERITPNGKATLSKTAETSTVKNKLIEDGEVVEPDITVGEMVGKPGFYKGEKGQFYQDGQAVVFKVEGKEKEYEIGNAQQIKDASISEYGITNEKSVVDIDADGNFNVRGEKYTNPFEERGQTPTDAIAYDKDGNIINVRMKSTDGKRRTFKGGVAEDLAYQIHLKEINKNNETRSEFEQFINNDAETSMEVDNARLSETPETSTVENNVEVPKSEEKVTSNEQATDGKEEDIIITKDNVNEYLNYLKEGNMLSPSDLIDLRTALRDKHKKEQDDLYDKIVKQGKPVDDAYVYSNNPDSEGRKLGNRQLEEMNLVNKQPNSFGLEGNENAEKTYHFTDPESLLSILDKNHMWGEGETSGLSTTTNKAFDHPELTQVQFYGEGNKPTSFSDKGIRIDLDLKKIKADGVKIRKGNEDIGTFVGEEELRIGGRSGLKDASKYIKQIQVDRNVVDEKTAQRIKDIAGQKGIKVVDKSDYSRPRNKKLKPNEQSNNKEATTKAEGVKVGEEMAGGKFPDENGVYDLLKDEEGRQGGSWTGNEFGDARFENEEQAKKYAKEVHDFLSSIAQQEEIPVYRAVAAEDVDLSPFGIGESWSFDIDAAKEFGKRLGVPLSEVKIISGKVPRENVDWDNAIRNYHNFSDMFSADSEFELPIPSNRVINDVKVQNFKDAKKIITIEQSNNKEATTKAAQQQPAEAPSGAKEAPIKDSQAAAKAKSLADKIRGGKIDKDIAMSGVPFLKQVWNGALEAMATAVELTGDIKKGIEAGIKYIKDSDWYKGLTKNQQQKAIDLFTQEQEATYGEPPTPPTQKKDTSNSGGRDKGVLNHLYNAKNIPEAAKEGFEKEGLKYETKSRDEAAKVADSIIEFAGVDEAVAMAEAQKFDGDVNSLIFGKALDKLSEMEKAAKTPQEKVDFAKKFAEVAITYDKMARYGGRFNSAIDYFYRKSPLGVVMYENAQRKDDFTKWAKQKNQSWKEFYDEMMKDPEFAEIIKQETQQQVKKERVDLRKARIDKVRSIFKKAKNQFRRGGAAYSTIIPPHIIETALEAMELAYEAGEAVAKIVSDAVDLISSKLGTTAWDKDKFTKEWTEKLSDGKQSKKLTDEQLKKRFLDRVGRKLEGLSDKEKNEVVRKSFEKIVAAGGLDYEDFRNIIASVTGRGELSDDDAQKIKELVAKANSVEDAAQKTQEERTPEALANFYKTQLEAAKAKRELDDLLFNKPNIATRLTSMLQLNTLGVAALVNNPIYNFWNQLTLRFPVGVVNTILDKAMTAAAKVSGGEHTAEWDVLSAQVQKEFFAKLGLGLKESAEQFATGLNRMDYTQKEVYGQAIRPWNSLKSLWGKSSRSRLSKTEILDKAIQASPQGWMAELIARSLNVGDKPQRFGAEGAQAAVFAKGLGLKGMDYKLFIAFPREEAYRAYKSKGYSDEAAAKKADYVKDVIEKEGKRSTFQQDNIANDMITKMFGGEKSGLGGLLKSTVVSPYLKIPLNAYWSYYNLINPEVALLQSGYYALKGGARLRNPNASFPFDKKMYGKDNATSGRDFREARYWLAHAAVGMAMRTVVLSMVAAGVFRPSASGDDPKKEREGESAFQKQGTINLNKLSAFLRGEDPTKIKGGLDVELRWFGQWGSIGNTIAKRFEDMTEEQRKNGERFWDMILGNLSESSLKELEQGIFANTSSLLSAANSDGSYFWKNWGLNTINLFTNIVHPAAFAQISRAELPYYSKTKADSFMGELKNSMLSRSSVLRGLTGMYPPAKVGIWGNKMMKSDNWMMRLFGVSTKNEDNFAQPIYEDAKRTGDIGFFPPALPPILNEKKLSVAQQDKLQELVGKQRKSYIAPFINDNGQIAGFDVKYSELTDGDKKFVLGYLYDLGKEEGVKKFEDIYPDFKKEEKQTNFKEEIQRDLFKILQKYTKSDE